MNSSNGLTIAALIALIAGLALHSRAGFAAYHLLKLVALLSGGGH